ncbi:MAG: outer membrane protein assembly factor BamD, partial [Candidatus Babeliales bacterium]|nr:outer membrane protein assembly factor BamD [Candidatus Babeliales bacterium]
TTRHTISTMTYDELREAKNRKIKEKNIDIAIKYAEKMLPLCKDMHEANHLTIELADLLFQNGDLEKAGKHYKEFAKLYPGYDKIEHAEHRSILCSFYGMLDATRDQTKTKETLELTQKFLERADVFTQFSAEVASIQKQCYARLVESEVSILEFYLNRDSLKAAQTRIDGLRKEFASVTPDLEPKLLAYEIQLAQKRNDPAAVELKQLELQEKFPMYSQVTVVLASADKKKTDFSQKF